MGVPNEKKEKWDKMLVLCPISKYGKIVSIKAPSLVKTFQDLCEIIGLIRTIWGVGGEILECSAHIPTWE
jgi:hypothetical protein